MVTYKGIQTYILVQILYMAITRPTIFELATNHIWVWTIHILTLGGIRTWDLAFHFSLLGIMEWAQCNKPQSSNKVWTVRYIDALSLHECLETIVDTNHPTGRYDLKK